MFEIIFLLVIGLSWILFASVQDLKQREVANWLNFSLIVFALGFRLFYGFFALDGFWLFYQGLIGFGIFFILGNVFYYLRLFAGGDAKLMIALGAVLPLSESFAINAKIFALFLILFLLVGAIYGILFSVFLMSKNFNDFKKEFNKRLKENRKLVYFVLFIGLVFMGLGFFESLLFFTGILIFITPYFYIYAKAVEETCMVKKVKHDKLAVGDWLYENVKISKGKKSQTIKAGWEGLSEKEIKLLKKSKKHVLIKQGIPFVPVFLISFLLLIGIYFGRLWNPLERFLF